MTFGGTASWRLFRGAAEAYIVIGAGFAVLCEAEQAADIVALVAVGAASVEILVSAVQGIPGDFVIAVCSGPGSVLLAARGDYGAWLDRGPRLREFSGAGVHPWHLAAFEHVDGLLLHSGHEMVTGPGTPCAVTEDRVVLRGVQLATELGRDAAHTLEDTLPSGRVPAPDPDAAADAVAATSFYRVRLGHGSAVALEVPVVLGRRPSLPRGADGSGTVLLTVPSPTRSVSATHLRVAQTGTSVVATDLRSTNGTILSAPGFRARRLRQGESVVVVPGTLIDIGDGNIVEILPVQAGSPPGKRPEETR